MTVHQLHKALGKMIAEGMGRRAVAVRKDSFTHHLESDGCVFIDVDSCQSESVMQMDGDGFAKINKDGTQSYRRMVVLYGSSVAYKEEPAHDPA